MKMAWQTETNHLVCRWSGVGERVPYNPQWIQDAARNIPTKSVSQPPLDFRKLSPLGRRRYGPDPVR
jgi:hypothetical protein